MGLSCNPATVATGYLSIQPSRSESQITMEPSGSPGTALSYDGNSLRYIASLRTAMPSRGSLAPQKRDASRIVRGTSRSMTEAVRILAARESTVVMPPVFIRSGSSWLPLTQRFHGLCHA